MKPKVTGKKSQVETHSTREVPQLGNGGAVGRQTGVCTELRRPAASSMLGPRPSTAPAPQRPLTMLPQQPDPWVIKKKRWLEAQHIRAAAVRRYTSGGAATATHRAASLENLEPVALVGGGSATKRKGRRTGR